MVFIIGGDGFVGTGFKRLLKNINVPFKVINRSNYDSFIGSSCDILINSNGNSKKFLANEDPKSEFSASVQSVRNSLVDFKFNKYVFLSTSDVYSDCSDPELTLESAKIDIPTLSNYGFHKYMAELCVRHDADDWLIIRQGGFVGEGMKKNAVFDVINGDKIWVHPDSRFQYIDTLVSATLIYKLIQKNISKEIFNLTGAGTISVREIMKLVGREVLFDQEIRPCNYEISTKKASQFIDLPSTFETVKKYIDEHCVK